MRISLQAMRESVAGWLQEEHATKGQTLELLEAVYAGVIDGGGYQGERDEGVSTPNPRFARVAAADYGAYQATNHEQRCGCLVDTLEVIRGERPDGQLGPKGSVAFRLAVLIPFGATPADNAWSQAAAQGIEDYYAAKGWR